MKETENQNQNAGASSGSSESRKVAKAAGLMSIATFCSRILGLVREQVIAYFFGAGFATDAFNVAYRIPNLLRDLFAEGAMSAAFIPTMSQVLIKKGEKSAWELANRVLAVLIFSSGVLALLGIYFAPELVGLFASGFSSVPGKTELTVKLVRIMFPFFPLVATAALCMGMLNVKGKFFVPALSPSMFNVCTILCCVLLAPVMEERGYPGITALALGVILGGFGQILLQLPLLFKKGFRLIVFYKPSDYMDSDLKKVLLLLVPGLFGLAATQINLLVNTVLATGAGEGAVSWLQFAFRLVQFPIGVFGVAIANATLPSVSRVIAKEGGNSENTRTIVHDSLSLVVMIAVPAMAGLYFLSQPIVHVIFERGAFSSGDTHQTATALQAYALGLIAYCGVKVVVPVFYALGKARVPVIGSGVSVILNIIFCLVLVKIMGHVGLALGTSLMMCINFLFLLTFLSKSTGSLKLGKLFFLGLRMLLASIAMGALVWQLELLLNPHIGKFMSLGVVLVISLPAVLIFAWILRVNEVTLLLALLRRLKERITRST